MTEKERVQARGHMSHYGEYKASRVCVCMCVGYVNENMIDSESVKS